MEFIESSATVLVSGSSHRVEVANIPEHLVAPFMVYLVEAGGFRDARPKGPGWIEAHATYTDSPEEYRSHVWSHIKQFDSERAIQMMTAPAPVDTTV